MNEPTGNRWRGDAAEAWLPYQPTAADPWTLAKVLRMHRRAGFGATWAEAQRDLADGYEGSIARVINGAPTGPDGRPAAAIEAFAQAMSDSYRNGANQLDSTRTVWFYRLVFGPFPLRERMLLAWHTHYATSENKVNNKPSLAEQHHAQRKLWRAPVRQMHLAMLRDEAMLRWLDGQENVRGAPNENLAREFFELFALGAGNYSEKDIQEAARALTGWQEIFERRQQLKYVDVLHDPGDKTIFGQSGAFGVEDLVRIVSAQPAAARRIAWRLWHTFISDVDQPTPEILEGLAAAMRSEGDVDVARGLEVLLRSRLFHGDAYVGRRVLSPVEWVATVVRTGQTLPPHPDLALLAAAPDKMGQRLFRPPNVAGWLGGLDWLSGAALVARNNFAAWLTGPESSVAADHWQRLAARSLIATPDAEVDFWTSLFWGRPPAEADRGRLVAQLATDDPAARARLVRTLLCSPAAQIA